MPSLTKLGLSGLLLALLVGGYLWSAASEAPPPTPPDPHATSSPTAHASPASNSPFLSTHEPQAVFTPGRDNVTPDLHAELEMLRQRVATNPDDAAARLRLARLLRDGHQAEAALPHFERYLELQPDDHQAWLDAAQTYGILARWADAQRLTETMLAQFPGDPSALYNLGAIHANQGRFDEAREVWQTVASQEDDPQMQDKAAQALQKLDRLHP